MTNNCTLSSTITVPADCNASSVNPHFSFCSRISRYYWIKCKESRMKPWQRSNLKAGISNIFLGFSNWLDVMFDFQVLLQYWEGAGCLHLIPSVHWQVRGQCWYLVLHRVRRSSPDSLLGSAFVLFCFVCAGARCCSFGSCCCQKAWGFYQSGYFSVLIPKATDQTDFCCISSQSPSVVLLLVSSVSL